jgi:hypothetical protein
LSTTIGGGSLVDELVIGDGVFLAVLSGGESAGGALVGGRASAGGSLLSSFAIVSLISAPVASETRSCKLTVSTFVYFVPGKAGCPPALPPVWAWTLLVRPATISLMKTFGAGPNSTLPFWLKMPLPGSNTVSLFSLR